MKSIPKVEKYMTTMPHTINKDVPLKTAINMMREHGFRHLPVQEAGDLVGVITDRDIKLASSISDSDSFLVGDVMNADPYCVTPQASLDSVVMEMAEHKFGCAVVRQENGKVVGIFTATDGLRVLGEVLRSNFKNS